MSVTATQIRRLTMLCATVGLTALSLSGCGGSSSPKGSSAPAAAGSSSAAPGSSSTGSAASTGKLDGVPTSCPSADEVMPNLQLTNLVVQSTDPSLCEYLSNGDATKPYAVITFNSAPGITAAAFEAGLRGGQSGVEAVPGLADTAFSFTAGAGCGLSFMSGTTVCSIATTVATTTAGEVALAKAILGG